MQNICALGENHLLFIDDSSFVWSCGSNQYGQLGLGDTTDRNIAEKTNLSQIKSISAGGKFSLYLDYNGDVFTCGSNKFGQLGLGNTTNRNIPEKINNLSQIISISAGYAHSLFLDNNGDVFTCGSNKSGQLGLGDRIMASNRNIASNRNEILKIEGIPKMKSISCGDYHSILMDFEGSAWSCGRNMQGQLGWRTIRNGSSHKFEKINTLPKINSIFGGPSFSMFIDEEGSIWGCGSNFYGELGLGDNKKRTIPCKNNNLPEIIAISGGHYCSMFLDIHGNVFTCGNNEVGQLGLVDTTSLNIANKISYIPKIRTIPNSSTAGEFFVIIDEEGSIWSCGSNPCGQLGLGDTEGRNQFEIINSIPKVQTNNRITKIKSARNCFEKSFEKIID